MNYERAIYIMSNIDKFDEYTSCEAIGVIEKQVKTLRELSKEEQGDLFMCATMRRYSNDFQGVDAPEVILNEIVNYKKNSREFEPRVSRCFDCGKLGEFYCNQCDDCYLGKD